MMNPALFSALILLSLTNCNRVPVPETPRGAQSRPVLQPPHGGALGRPTAIGFYLGADWPGADKDARLELTLAEEHLNRQDFQQNPFQLALMGNIALYQGQYGRAAQWLVQSMELAEPTHQVRQDLAVARMNLVGNDPTCLLEAWDLLAEGEPDAATHFNRSLILEKLGLKDHAVLQLQACIEKETDPYWQTLARGKRAALVDSGPVWNEQALLEAIVKKDRETAEALIRQFSLPSRELAEHSLLAMADVASDDEVREIATTIGRLRAEIFGDLYLFEVMTHLGATPGPDLKKALTFYRSGVAAYESWQIDEARTDLQQAHRLFKKSGSPLVHRAALYLALCDYQVENYGKALKVFTKLGQLAESMGYYELEGMAWRMVGTILAIDKQDQPGLDAYSRSLAAYQRVAERDNIAALHCLTATSYLGLGHPVPAWDHLLMATSLVARLHKPQRRYGVYSETADALSQQGAYALAALMREQEVEAARAWNHPVVLAGSLGRLARARFRMGLEAVAWQNLEESLALAQRIKDPSSHKTVMGDLLRFRGEMLSQSDPVAAREALDQAVAIYRETGYEAHLPLLLADRAAVYQTLGEADLAAEDLEAALAIYQARRGTITDRETRITFFDTARRHAGKMVLLQIERGQTSQGLAALEQFKARFLWDRDRQKAGPGGLSDPQTLARSLNADTALIEWAVIDNRLLTWTLYNARVQFHQSPWDPIQDDKRCQTLIRNIKNRAEVRASAHALFEQLLGPSLEQIPPGTTLVLVPDGVLHRLPWAALYDGSRWLAQRHPLVIAPGGGWSLSGSPVAENKGISLLLGNPELHPDLDEFGSLMFARQEVEEAASLLPDPIILTRADASRKAFLELAGTANLIHFAGHAVSRQEKPGQSFLALAGPGETPLDGMVYAHELAALDLSGTSLVVLSACDSKTGPLSSSEGELGLAHALLSAGTKAVIAGSWNVDDYGAVQLFQQFYSLLARGESPEKALQQAQVALIDSNDQRLAHPFVWATFQYMGRQTTERSAFSVE